MTFEAWIQTSDFCHHGAAPTLPVLDGAEQLLVTCCRRFFYPDLRGTGEHHKTACCTHAARPAIC